jgi:hypothetical protein
MIAQIETIRRKYEYGCPLSFVKNKINPAKKDQSFWIDLFCIWVFVSGVF